MATRIPSLLRRGFFGLMVVASVALALRSQFGGSGTTMIACEKAGRQARLIELEPRYCDVAIRRWQEYTGDVARHADSGRAFNELAAEIEVAHPVSHSQEARNGTE